MCYSLGRLVSLLDFLIFIADSDIVKGCVAFSRDATAEFARFVEEHGIKPVIAKEFSFEDTVGAFKALEKQDTVGKIVVKIT